MYKMISDALTVMQTETASQNAAVNIERKAV